MTKFDYFRCDECGKKLERCECSPIQLMYTLEANYDTAKDLGFHEEGMSNTAHFCGQKCLMKYVETKVKEHEDLPIHVEPRQKPKSSEEGK